MRRHGATLRIPAATWILLALVPALGRGERVALRLLDLEGDPIPEVVLRAEGGNPAPASDDHGRLVLEGRGLRAGSGWLTLEVVREPGAEDRWFFVRPWDRKLWVRRPVAGQAAGEPILLARQGDPRLLGDDRGLASVAAGLVVRRSRRWSPDRGERPVEREAAVADVGTAAGLDPAELAGALGSWRGGAGDPFQRGLSALERGADEEARQWLTQAWRGGREIESRPPAEIVDTAFFLALALEREGEFGGSAFLLRKAVELRGEDPVLLAALGRALYLAGDWAGARQSLTRVLEVEERVFGSEDPRLAPTLANLAAVDFAAGDPGAAEPLFRRALAIDEAALGSGHPEVASDLNNLASVRAARGDLGAARELLERALAIREAALGESDPEVATTLNNLAVVHFEKGSLHEAREMNRRALGIDEAAFGPEHPYVATDLANLALVSDRLGLSVEAERLYRRALDVRDAVLEPTHPDLAQSLEHLAWSLHRAGRLSEAEPLYRRAVEILEASGASESQLLALALKHLGMLCQRQERFAEAEPLYRRSLRIFEKTGPESPELISLLWSYADLLCQIGRAEQGAQFEKRATALRARLAAKPVPD